MGLGSMGLGSMGLGFRLGFRLGLRVGSVGIRSAAMAIPVIKSTGGDAFFQFLD
jgi:hypothetical protein